MRLFFALWPDDTVRDHLYSAAQALQRGTGGRLVKRGNLHQTLAFLGNVALDALPRLEAIAAGVRNAAIHLDFGSTGYWRHNRIAWAAPFATPEALSTLVCELERGLRAADLRVDARAYSAHVTLMRNARAPAAFPPLAFAWRVGDFALMESLPGEAGPVYRVRARWPLAANVE